MSLIVLLTDFGTKDGFVGAVKGVLLSINPYCQIVDLTHEVEPFNVMEGALILRAHYRYFPKGSIFLGVVDPGVGSERKAVAVRCGAYTFVGPMNGLFDLALRDIAMPPECYLIENFTLPRINQTFHGRDVFAPVCGYLSKGVPLQMLGRRIEYEFLLEWEKAKEFKNKIEGKVIHFDRYGNAITNVPCGKYSHVVFRGQKIKVVSYFLEGEREQINAVCGSFGYMELFVPMGNAKERFGISLGEEVCFFTSEV
ncbi:SAM-dependent chlorinase/fluorinase [Thermocrinis sp.]|uniref:SAM hydrolase/SAM-dependent halogenase family protein n=1 Tax=Thermocrinis sp. TaxID=2024383 RepID=UPI002FDC88E9